MKFRVALFASVAVLSACGDNSNECDPGTTRNENGVCVGTLTCSDGTILVDGKCEIDPNACQGGTVLVGDACVDPGVVMADIEEGAEPNGLGILEQSTTPAGEIMLKAEGQHFVIHGKIVPFRDDDGDGQQDPDIDTYFVEVTAPTMLTISADGLHGLAGGFLSVANVASTDVLSDWTRFGINLTGDTSKRQLYLPAAGTYLIAVGDSRSLLLSGGAAGAAEGKPAFEYYVTIDRVTATPTPLTFANGVATSSGMRQPGEVKLFSATLGEGINTATLETTQSQVQASVMIVNTRGTTTKVLGLGDAAEPDPAEAGAIGVRTGDTSIVVADSVFDYANQPTFYDLTVEAGTAGALSTSGGDVAQPGSETDFSTFYYDVAPDGLTVGLDLAFDKPVSGVVVDEDFFIFSLFTFDPQFGFAFGDTFQAYKGLMRHAKPGRYYFLVFDPAFDPAAPEDITATSTYGAVALTPIVKGTPLANQAINAFESNPFTYAPGTAMDPWQEFTGSGTGTGTITAVFYDPNTAIGRMDALTNTCGSFCDDRPVPVFAHTYAAGGETRGRILLDNANLNMFLVTVNTATVTGAPTFSLDFRPRAGVTDLGTAAVGTPVASNDKTLDNTTTLHRFLVRTNNGNGLTINAHPDAGSLNPRIQRINSDESANGALVNAGGAGADETTSVIQGGAGWTAFVVDGTGGPGTFDLTVTATPAVTYATAAGTTAFTDACAAGSTVTMDDLDEGQSVAINAPAGFTYFGFPVSQFEVYANGFLSFDTSLACATVGASCFFGNADMPGAANPNAIVAPYWDDIVLTSVCQHASGTKLTIQWDGTLFNDNTQAVSMQVILDGSNDTVEFVYGTGHTATGSSATVGIENQVGSAAKKLSFNTATAAAPTLFTPM